MPPGFTVPDPLARAMCTELGVAVPTTTDDVTELYRAWCGAVPFDTITKSLAVSEGRVPPGDDPVEFCERWLETRVGGMCWGHCTAFAAVLASFGIPATVGLDRMLRDDVVDFHSFVVADLDGGHWVCDTVHASGVPLPLQAGVRGTHPVLATGLDAGPAGESAAGRLEHWFVYPSANATEWRYAVLSTVLDRQDVRAFCEVSIRFSGMGSGRFSHRRSPATSMVAASATDDCRGVVTKVYDDNGALTERAIDDLDEAFAFLGYRDGARQMAERAGLFAPAAGRR